MSITVKSPGYTQIVLSQIGDYVAIRTNDHKTSQFSCLFSDKSVFDGAKVKFYKNFTNKDGEIGDCETGMVSGSGENIIYTQSQQVSISGIMPSDWYIFKVLEVGTSTNIILGISGINSEKYNIKTNVLNVQSL